jgi:autotransporter-associated beta strand protein
MKNTTHIVPSFPGEPSSPPRIQSRLFLAVVAVLLLLLSSATTTFAGSATWLQAPATNDWNTAGNWTPATVPNWAADTATFQSSNTTGVSISADTEVNGIVFNAGANMFTITASPVFFFSISGVGITNNSGITQSFVTAVDGAGSSGVILFTNSATAGSLTAFTNSAAVVSGTFAGQIFFADSSTAGNGTFTNNGGAVSGAFGGTIEFSGTSTASHGIFTNNGSTVTDGYGGGTFFGGNSTADKSVFMNNGGPGSSLTSGLTAFSATSTAGNAVFTNNGGVADSASGGNVQFADTSVAGNGTFINNGTAVSGASGGQTIFFSMSSASNATLVAKSDRRGGGAILFFEDSAGGTARVQVFGNGTLDISGHYPPSVSVGSIEGSGVVTLGFNELTVGSNNRDATFSGVIQEGLGGATGSLIKTGKGKLVLTSANTYRGGTTVNGGKLLVNNTSGSGTGKGTVQVNGGTLGGTGKIAGAVIVGTGSGTGAFVSPGNSATKPGTLTIKRKLTFNSDATYKFQLNSSTGIADKVVAHRVTVNSGAQFSFADVGGSALPPGTVFTVMDNTAATPIAGTFSNLPDGSTFTNNGNSYQVNYEGGTGNDLTLTVVP